MFRSLPGIGKFVQHTSGGDSGEKCTFAKDCELWSLLVRHLSHQWKQVVGDAPRVLADEPRRMSAHGIKITKKAGSELRVRLATILDDCHARLGFLKTNDKNGWD